MDLFGLPDPRNDELAQRVENAKRMLMQMRGATVLDDEHFPDRRRR